MLVSHFFPVVLQKQLKREDEQQTLINSSLFYRGSELPSFLFRSQPPFLFFGFPDTSKTSRHKRQGSVTVNYDRDYEKLLQQVRFF